MATTKEIAAAMEDDRMTRSYADAYAAEAASVAFSIEAALEVRIDCSDAEQKELDDLLVMWTKDWEMYADAYVDLVLRRS